ncbi:CYTH and CHAD domain-containing protein [Streptomyces sp. HSW2009]|uniref:CYTH and CHAD domain-containing protein n=1 Tax=Streptomyces sp. HSW2009 TaxID=3142890 RepID=UPI0032EB2C12
MAHTVREIERKYEAAPGAAPIDSAARAGLAELPGVARVAEQGVSALDATYYDTADQRLAADGVTLRRRTGGSDAGWHLKLPALPGGVRRSSGDAGDLVRDEVRAPLADALPAELAALARSRTRAADLLPLVELRTRRTVWHLLDAAGARLAEVSADEVSARRTAGGAAVHWWEVEVELAAGETALLDAVAHHLAAQGLRPARTGSKLARALTETAPPTAADPTTPAAPPDAERKTSKAQISKPKAGKSKAGKPKVSKPESKGPKNSKSKNSKSKAGEPEHTDLTAGDVVLTAVRRQIAAIVALDPAVRLEAPDAVHQMRVATRRLRSVFRSYRTVVDRSVTDPLGAELKWLAGALGVDRDREVLTERLTAGLDAVPGPLRLGPVRARLAIWSSGRRASSRQQVVEVLDGPRYLALLDELAAFRTPSPDAQPNVPDAQPQATNGQPPPPDAPPLSAAGQPLLLSAAARPPRKVVRAAVLRDVERLARRVEAALAEPAGATRDEALHVARKAAKRARYAAEAAEAGLGPAARELARRMQRVQQVLGDHQDSVMARTTLRDLAVQAHAAGESTFTLGLIYGREEAVAATRERELPGVWSAALTPPPRKLL